MLQSKCPVCGSDATQKVDVLVASGTSSGNLKGSSFSFSSSGVIGAGSYSATLGAQTNLAERFALGAKPSDGSGLLVAGILLSVLAGLLTLVGVAAGNVHATATILALFGLLGVVLLISYFAGASGRAKELTTWLSRKKYLGEAWFCHRCGTDWSPEPPPHVTDIRGVESDIRGPASPQSLHPGGIAVPTQEKRRDFGIYWGLAAFAAALIGLVVAVLLGGSSAEELLLGGSSTEERSSPNAAGAERNAHQETDAQVRDITALAVASASSVLPPDVSMTFAPVALTDGNLSTSWQPNAKRTRGVGEWFALDFKSSHAIVSLEIANGFQSNWKGQDLFTMNARLDKVVIELGDRTIHHVFAANERGFVRIPVEPPANASRIVVRIASVHRGSRWPDLAVSEIRVIAQE